MGAILQTNWRTGKCRPYNKLGEDVNKKFYILCFIFYILLLLTGCSKKIYKINGDSIIEASIGDASFLNPILATDSASGDINSLVFNGLVKYDKDIKLVGDLAESWEISKNGLIITFHLRKGVKWHDGKDFTSADVKWTYQCLINPNVKTPYFSDFERVRKLEVPDSWTVRVVYKEPFAPALESWGIGIVPKHLLENEDFNKAKFNRYPVGTGPYIFKEWNTMEKIVLEANPNYFEGSPCISRYVYRIIPDLSVQFSELLKGTVDSMGLDSDQYAKEGSSLPVKYGVNVYRHPNINSYTYLGFNLLNSLFKDKRVRQAIACAINKQEIVNTVLQGFGRTITGPYPPSFWAYNNEIEDYNYDLNKAKHLLELAGWQDKNNDGILDKNGIPFEFTIITNQGNKEREMCATIIQDKLSKIGMKVKIRILEWSTFIHEYVDKKKFDAIVLGWSLSLDPDQYSMWHSSQSNKGYNFISYRNKEIDKLLEDGRRIFDQEKRKKIYNRFHEILADEQPYCFLYVRDAFPAVHKRFKGIKVEPLGISYNFIKWFVPKNEQKYVQ